MTEKELKAITDKIMPSIEKLAFIFVRKFKQPSSYSKEDLVSEAIYTIVGQVDSGRPDASKGATVTTYLLTAIRGRFLHLIAKSYRSDYDPEMARKRNMGRLQRDLTYFNKYPDSFGSDVLLTLQEELSNREQEYVSLIIFPPEDILNKIDRDSKKVRGHVREFLRMGREEEKEIRKKIKGILLETV